MRLHMWLVLGLVLMAVPSIAADLTDGNKGEAKLRMVCFDPDGGEGGPIYQLVAVTKPLKMRLSNPARKVIQMIAHYCLVKASAGTPGVEKLDYKKMYECKDAGMVKLLTRNVKLRKTTQLISEVFKPDSKSQAHVALLYLNTPKGEKVTSFFEVNFPPPKNGVNTDEKASYTCSQMVNPITVEVEETK